MKLYETIMQNFGTRFLSGLAVILLGGIGAIVFPPLAVLVFPGAWLFTAVPENAKGDVAEARQTAVCANCGGETKQTLIRVRRYAYSILPIISLLKLPIGTGYYVVCDSCRKKHSGDDSIPVTLKILEGGLIQGRRLTREEYESMK